jgi:hypothetical protein
MSEPHHSSRRLYRLVLVVSITVATILCVGLITISDVRIKLVNGSWTWRDPWMAVWGMMNSRSQSCGCGCGRTEADIQNLSSQLQIFEALAGRFPTQAEGMQVLVTGTYTEGGRRIPKLLDSQPLDCWRRPYQYRFPAVHSRAGFDLFTLGPDGVVSPDDVGNWE